MSKSTGTREFHIDLIYDEEVDVFVVKSKDIPGLVLEEETIGSAMDALLEYGPRLIKSNLGIQLKGEFRFMVTPRKVSKKQKVAPRKVSFKPRIQIPESTNLPMFAVA